MSRSRCPRSSRQLATVTADTAGNISYAFTAAGVGIAAGRHEVEIHSMLLDQSAHSP